MTALERRQARAFAQAFGLLSLTSIVFYLVNSLRYDDWHYYFLLWNLFLAWLPLLISWLLIDYLKKNRWLSPIGVGLSLLWLIFIPNSFYMLSDLVHLQATSQVDVLFYVIMFSSFAITGLMLGLTSLHLIHREFIKRFTRRTSTGLVAAILLVSSFAIYLGRDLRWNTWDVFFNPSGLLFDVSDPLIDPSAHPHVFLATGGLFVLLGSLYLAIWLLLPILKPVKSK